MIRLAPALGALLIAAGTAKAESVAFPGPGLSLRGELFKPPGNGPFPAVVALHGCGGLYSTRTDGLSARHADWAERLTALGFIVLFPDSFGSRGVGSQCRTRDRVIRASRDRPADALAARTWLQDRADVKADAVSLLGWSNGGSSVLHTVSATRKVRDGKPDFARAVAFYPGCRTIAERGGWRPRMPLLLLIGAADDWTPAAPCGTLARQAGSAVTFMAYPGAYHDFDHPNLKVRTRSGLAFTADGGGTAHTGTDPEARADAIVRVPAFLAR